jgi:TRAP-type C4-dicarboxylate transport system permease small subunit
MTHSIQMFMKNNTVKLTWLGGALLICSSLLITIEVFVRKVFSISIGGADEIVGYAFAIFTAISLPYALIHKANIRIDIFYRKLPDKVRPYLDLFAHICLSGFVILLTLSAYDLATNSFMSNSRAISPLGTLLYIPQSIWLVGLITFSLTLIVLFILSLISLFKKDYQLFQSLIGALSFDEEIAEEVHIETDKNSSAAAGGK